MWARIRMSLPRKRGEIDIFLALLTESRELAEQKIA